MSTQQISHFFSLFFFQAAVVVQSVPAAVVSDNNFQSEAK